MSRRSSLRAARPVTGWLWKKARGRKHGILSRDTWKRRFFSLSNGQLNYYTGQTGTLKGSIEIKATTLACPVPAVSNKTHCFEIRDSNSPQPLLLLAVGTKADGSSYPPPQVTQRNWIRALKATSIRRMLDVASTRGDTRSVEACSKALDLVRQERAPSDEDLRALAKSVAEGKEPPASVRPPEVKSAQKKADDAVVETQQEEQQQKVQQQQQQQQQQPQSRESSVRQPLGSGADLGEESRDEVRGRATFGGRSSTVTSTVSTASTASRRRRPKRRAFPGGSARTGSGNALVRKLTAVNMNPRLSTLASTPADVAARPASTTAGTFQHQTAEGSSQVFVPEQILSNSAAGVGADTALGVGIDSSDAAGVGVGDNGDGGHSVTVHSIQDMQVEGDEKESSFTELDLQLTIGGSAVAMATMVKEAAILENRRTTGPFHFPGRTIYLSSTAVKDTFPEWW